ncbi:MAG: threonine synthase [Candidatus Binatia bacterium]
MTTTARPQRKRTAARDIHALRRNGVGRVHLKCARCGYEVAYARREEKCEACGWEWLDLVYRGVTRDDIINDSDALGRGSMWRYRRLLPIEDDRHIVSMGEGMTPLLHGAKFGARLGLHHVYIKDERPSATGSFKDRAASICISNWVELGIKEMAVSSTGNVAASFAAYSARAGIQLWIFMPEKVNATKYTEVLFYGQNVIKVEGTYDQAGIMAKRFAQDKGIPVDPGIRSPFRRESMKSLAFEIAEDLNWDVPDWYVQAVSGGIGPLGVWKGFQELYALGLTHKMPKIACIQASGCAPMAQAFLLDSDEILEVTPHTEIETLTTGRPAGYPLIYKVVKESGGHIGSVDDDEAFRAQELLAQSEGIFAESAAAVAAGGLVRMANEGLIKPDETVVCVCSGKGLRDIGFVRRRMKQSVFISLPGECADFSTIRMHRDRAR